MFLYPLERKLLIHCLIDINVRVSAEMKIQGPTKPSIQCAMCFYRRSGEESKQPKSVLDNHNDDFIARFTD